MNLPLPSSVVNGSYSFSRSELPYIEWMKHRKALTLRPNNKFMQYSMPLYMRKPAAPLKMFTETREFFAVPPIYGLLHFGPAFKDKRQDGDDLPARVEFTGKLWGPDQSFNQLPVFEAMCQLRRSTQHGMTVNLPTGCGKTTIMLAFVATELKKKTLIIVHTSPLLDQWKHRIVQYFPAAQVGIIRSTACEIEGKDFVVATIQTLLRREYPRSVFASFGAVIMDECHTVGAAMFSKVFYYVGHIRYLLGISATPERKDGMHSIFPMWFGPCAYTAPRATKLSRQTIVRYETFVPVMEPQVIYRQAPPGTTGQRVKNHSAMIEAMTKDMTRNRFVVTIVERLLAQGKHVLLLSERVEHISTLLSMIKINDERRVKDTKEALQQLSSSTASSSSSASSTTSSSSSSSSAEGTDTTRPIANRKRKDKGSGPGSGSGSASSALPRRRTLAQYFSGMTSDQRDKIDLHPHDVVGATYAIYAVGKDTFYLDALVFATPISSVEQVAGRLRHGGIIIDIVDRLYLGRQKRRHAVYMNKEFIIQGHPLTWGKAIGRAAPQNKRKAQSMSATGAGGMLPFMRPASALGPATALSDLLDDVNERRQERQASMISMPKLVTVASTSSGDSRQARALEVSCEFL